MNAARGYRAWFRITALRHVQYRAAALAGLITQVFWGLIMVMAYDAFFRSSSAAQPMRLTEVITYIWLGQAFLRMLPWNLEPELVNSIRSGAIACDLLRPVDVYGVWYWRILAWRLIPTLMRGAPMLVLARLFWGLQPPASPEAALAALAALAGALALGCAISALLTAGMFWTVSGDGANYLVTALVVLLSGNVIPLPLFPDWAQTALRLLPFSGLADTPYRLYLGLLPVHQWWLVLAHQAVWTALLVMVGRTLTRRGLSRLVVHGG